MGHYILDGLPCVGVDRSSIAGFRPPGRILGFSIATVRYDATQGKPVQVNRWGKEKFPAFEEHAVSSGASEYYGGALVWEDNISAGWAEIRAPHEERRRTPLVR